MVTGSLGISDRSTFAGDLVDQTVLVALVVCHLVPDHPQHGRPLLPAACAVAQAGGYATGVTGSTIHNFRS